MIEGIGILIIFIVGYATIQLGKANSQLKNMKHVPWESWEKEFRTCPVCKCVDTKSPYLGVLGDVNVRGAHAEKCYICEHVTLSNKQFLEDLKKLDNAEWAYTKIGELIRKHVMSYASSDNLYNSESLHNLLDWSLKYMNEPDESVYEYVRSVIQRAKLKPLAEIESRIYLVVAEDIRSSFGLE